MSYNYYNRAEAWPGQDTPPENTSPSQGAAPLQPPGFRNPWFSQPPLKSQNAQQPLLLAQKRQSFVNQLPTTYEHQGQQAQPLLPPTRADNPFNQYYTNQDVLLHHFPDRRMSAAVDGLMYNPYTLFNNQMPPPAPGGQAQYVNMANAGARRSSVAAGSLYHAPSRYMSARVGHSPVLATHLPPSAPRVVPRVQKISNKGDLRPKIHNQPKYRRRSVNLMHISPVNALLVYLTESYAMCQPQKFRYLKMTNPKRVLTKPLEPRFNNGYDNEDSDYILYVNDLLGAEEGRKYVVLDLLGSGTFGQVVKCQNLANQLIVAVKVIKSKPAYLNQLLQEVKLCEFLNQNLRSGHFIRLLDTFMHREHLCLVFELLASNLYELIKQNQFHGLNMKLVKLLTKQLLELCVQLKNFQIIHCDLKPENILLCQPDKPDIKVIDFGSACFTRQTIYSYIQSRFYRSPEVILGLPYSESIDMWSLGCIVGELFLGLPMFPGSSEYNQVWKIVDMLGNPPRHMIEVGRNALNFFDKVPSPDANGKPTYVIKSHEEYLDFLRKSKGKEEVHKAEQANKNYFNHRLLKDIILNYKMPSRKMTQTMIDKEYKERHLLVDFLQKVLNLNPLERLTPLEALKHPFVNDSPSSSLEKSSLSSASSSNDPLRADTEVATNV